MSGPQEYYQNLIAQGYDIEQAKIFTQQRYPGFSPVAPMAVTPNPGAPLPTLHVNQMSPQVGSPMGAPMGAMGAMMPASAGNGPRVLNWVALGLTAAAITMVFIAMFSNSWMIYDVGDDNELVFGFSGFEARSAGDLEESQDYDSCNEDECPDMEDAGTTGMIFLWIAAAVIIGSLVLICLNNFGVFQSYIGMITAFVGGTLAIVGVIIWLTMFPSIDSLDEMSNGPGFSFYLAIIGGVLSIGSGACQIKY